MSRIIFPLFVAVFFPIFLAAQSLQDCRRACDSLYDAGNYKNGLDVAQACLQIAQNLETGRDSVLSAAYMRVGNFQYRLHQSAEAAATYQLCLEARQRFYGPFSTESVSAMHSLGNALTQQGRLFDSQKILLQSLAIRDSIKQKPAKVYAATLNSLGIIAIELGNMHEAEKYFSEAGDRYTDLVGETSREFITTLGNLAQVNIVLGNYDRSRLLLKKSLEIREIVFGKEHPMYASSLTGLAELYQNTENWAESEPLLRQAIEIRRAKLGEDNPVTLSTISELARAMLHLGRVDSAQIVLVDLIARLDAQKDATEADMADLLADLGDVFLAKNEIDSAHAFFEKANFFQKKSLPDTRVPYLHSLRQMAQTAMLLGLFSRADSLYRETQAIELKSLEVYFPHFSDRERQLFFQPVASEIERFATFTEKFADSLSTLAGQLLDLRLATRGILFSASQKMQEQFRQSGNLKNFEAWQLAREQLAQLYFSPPENPQNLGVTLAELTETVRSLEKKLGDQNSRFSEQTDTVAATWQKVRAALGPGDAALEIVRFHKQAATATDEVCYIGLLITKETVDRPVLIRFEDGNELETVIYELYRSEMGQAGQRLPLRGTPAFRNFWSPIEPFLAGKKRVHFALDGVFHKINLGTLRGPDGTFLSEKYDFRYLTNLADLLHDKTGNGQKKHHQLPQTALLVGNPSFDFFEKNTVANGNGNPHFVANIAAELRGIDLRPLPESGVEVLEIGLFLEKKHCTAKVFIGKNATESVVKSVDSVAVLHLATHGFFLEDLSGKSVFDTNFAIRSPLLRSMLFFAGSKNRLLDDMPNPSADGQDGILTAFEVQNMSLETTELVTLSACQTGLGDVISGEGVFGLQRAFRVAGAGALLMSLWNVDDEATRLLMTVFYEKWFDGLSKTDALRAAEASVRLRFPEPEKWGGFVLIGD